MPTSPDPVSARTRGLATIRRVTVGVAVSAAAVTAGLAGVFAATQANASDTSTTTTQSSTTTDDSGSSSSNGSSTDSSSTSDAPTSSSGTSSHSSTSGS